MNPIRAWNRFLFGPISARPLGLFRIVFGLLIMIYLAVMTVEFDHWFTGAGLLQGTEAREAAGPLRISPLHYVTDPVTPRIVHLVAFAAALGVTLGWRTRVMSVVLYFCMLSFYHRNVSSNGGPDALPLILSFYMMLCPSGAAYSLDARREAKRRGTPAEQLIVPWGVRLLQMQFCLIYFQSCVIKCDGATWMDGTSVHYVLFNREFGWFNLEWLGAYPMLINVMTLGAMLIEFSLAFWLWFRPTRRWAILGGVLLHGGIRVVLNIPGFGEIMCATYLMFLDPDEVGSLLRVLDPRGWLARLGIRRPSLDFLRGADRSMALPSWQQREFAFDGAEVHAGAETMAVR
jgi:Vitamin K-dependent gamma-carboxylase